MDQSGQYIETQLRFLEWQDLYKKEKPYEIYVDLPAGREVQQNNLVFQTRRTRIKDVRGFEDSFKLEQHGFQFHSSTTKLIDAHLNDRHIVEAIYLPEVEQILRTQYPNASRIFMFDWRIRKYQPPNHEPLDLNNRNAYLRPATEVHIDQSPTSVVRRIQLQLGSEAPDLLKQRVRVINVWRPLINAVLDWPLALCDATTADPQDFIECDNIRKHYTGSTMYVLYNSAMQWYFLSSQGKDVATMFKIFDSSPMATSKSVPHTGFELPAVPEGTEPRRSIEVRALVFTPH